MAEKWLTIKEAAELAGESEWAIRDMLKPDHPAAIPHIARPMRGDRTRYRIPADAFAEWLKAHTHGTP